MTDLFTIAQIGLAVALVASLAVFIQDRNRVPVSDPWFIPVIGILLLQSFK